MKIGLFFGSFNPIHTGHLIIANHVINFYTDEVWFIVSPQNPFKQSNELLDAQYRLQLMRPAIKDNKKFKALDIEFHLPKPSYTINTLKVLSKNNPNHEFFLIIGSDNLQHFTEWKSSAEIINNYTILIYERPGFPINIETERRVTFLNAPLINISATEIRKLIAENKSIRYLVPENVCKEIESNGYFK